MLQHFLGNVCISSKFTVDSLNASGYPKTPAVIYRVQNSRIAKI